MIVPVIDQALAMARTLIGQPNGVAAPERTAYTDRGRTFTRVSAREWRRLLNEALPRVNLILVTEREAIEAESLVVEFSLTHIGFGDTRTITRVEPMTAAPTRALAKQWAHTRAVNAVARTLLWQWDDEDEAQDEPGKSVSAPAAKPEDSDGGPVRTELLPTPYRKGSRVWTMAEIQAEVRRELAQRATGQRVESDTVDVDGQRFYRAKFSGSRKTPWGDSLTFLVWRTSTVEPAEFSCRRWVQYRDWPAHPDDPEPSQDTRSMEEVMGETLPDLVPPSNGTKPTLAQTFDRRAIGEDDTPEAEDARTVEALKGHDREFQDRWLDQATSLDDVGRRTRLVLLARAGDSTDEAAQERVVMRAAGSADEGDPPHPSTRAVESTPPAAVVGGASTKDDDDGTDDRGPHQGRADGGSPGAGGGGEVPAGPAPVDPRDGAGGGAAAGEGGVLPGAPRLNTVVAGAGSPLPPSPAPATASPKTQRCAECDMPLAPEPTEDGDVCPDPECPSNTTPAALARAEEAATRVAQAVPLDDRVAVVDVQPEGTEERALARDRRERAAKWQHRPFTASAKKSPGTCRLGKHEIPEGGSFYRGVPGPEDVSLSARGAPVGVACRACVDALAEGRAAGGAA